MTDKISTLCACWLLSRKDGAKFGMTNHDMDLEFDGIVYAAATGWDGSDRDHNAGLAIDNSGALGLLSDDRISAHDLKSGLYDEAEVLLQEVDWQDVSKRRLVWRAQIGQIRVTGDSFEAELLGASVKLERSTGRVFSRMCDAEFGDARCGVDASAYPDGTTCPRSFTACRDRFANALNFRGFPYLIGDDAMQSGPQAGQAKTGGSRYDI